MNWTDLNLSWDPDEYDDLKLIHLHYDQIWKPDIILYNSIDSSTGSSVSTDIPINSKGQALWWSRWIFKSKCSMNMQYFPFDVQKCFLDFGSWSFDNSDINVIPDNQDADLDVYHPNSEFDLVKYTIHNYTLLSAEWTHPFLYIRYTIVLKRKPLYYLFNILMPTVLLVTISLLAFLVHGSEEKISIGLTTLLSMVVLQMVVADKLPPVSDAVPLISLYYGISILLISLSISVNAVTMNVYHYGDGGREVPLILKRTCFGILSRFLCISISEKEKSKQKDPDVQHGHSYRPEGEEESTPRHRVSETSKYGAERSSPDRIKDLVLLEEMLQLVLRSINRENDMRVQEEQRTDSLKREWQELACVLDRLFLVIFLIIYACLTMSVYILDQN
ncbi:neuronal acetylcholine receptor subunit alpha-7-like [Saccostrea echinata]|uniref:neuronal acetylcholine receptor subunit alpha-7-like n=1 Tax=Saccostrea echinata TaxID=191078 RepID=UPI002A7FE3CA|nr:neuronal acetylcholine receptor subunit alpha-7-like [Saccostrea echinata]